ncbi:hypothetical protein [Aliikangiella coralliicola]|uniref:Uncharacterized protein n=1 Tax=Aliikangiella coralliicola TaxID=2592383 RepID=A0A545UEE7_9GAMM|nr:hypothetical protein [Aliikangiella coralliicola]TQV87805.1 hypothetical protein FLL46_10495 [Aliikangiella coralliicola]
MALQQAGAITTEYQFESLYQSIRSSDDYYAIKEQTNKFLSIGICISIFLHLSAGQLFWFQHQTMSSTSEQPSKSFKINLLSGTNSKPEKQQISQQVEPHQREKTESDNREPKSQISEKKTEQPEDSSTNKSPEKTAQSKIENTSQNTQSTADKQIVFEDILDGLRKQTLNETQESEFLRSDFIVMDPKLRQKLDDILREKKRIEAISEKTRKRKENEFYEFQSYGNDRTVRINGKCFQLQKQPDFSDFNYLWTSIGSCENKVKLDFTKRKLDQEYLGKTY